MMMHRILCALVGVALIGLTVSSCGPERTNGSELRKVVVGVSAFQDTLVPMVGAELGYYEEVGLDVEFKILGWTEIPEALSSRSAQRIDVGINNISSVIATHERNPEIVYYYGVNPFDNGFALLIRPDSGFRTLSEFVEGGLSRDEATREAALQLREMRIITTANTDMEQGVAAAAARAGISFNDLEIINLPPDEGLAAFLTGRGDAFIGGIPQRARAEREGMRVLISGVDLGPPPINGYVTTRSFAESEDDILSDLIHVWFRSVNYINDNPQAGASIVVEILNRNSGAQFSNADFLRYWNEYESFMSSPSEVEAVILSENGDNYWRDRWDDTNHYFYNVKGTISEPVAPEAAFLMFDAHERFLERHGRELE